MRLSCSQAFKIMVDISRNLDFFTLRLCLPMRLSPSLSCCFSWRLYSSLMLFWCSCSVCSVSPNQTWMAVNLALVCCIVEKMSALPCLHGSLLLFCSFDELLARAILLARMWIAMVVMSPSRWRMIQQLKFPQVTGSSSLQQATPWWLLLHQGIQQQTLTRKLLRTAVVA